MLRFLRKLQEITAAGVKLFFGLTIRSWKDWEQTIRSANVGQLQFVFVFFGGGVILILYNKNISLQISEA